MSFFFNEYLEVPKFKETYIINLLAQFVQILFLDSALQHIQSIKN